ncbi:MAG: hypothetical protein AAFX44_12770 [Pseudomonadota bacterium]
MTTPSMPAARDYGWVLKPNSSTHFAIEQRPNGQFWVVLNHSLLRGCSAQMLHWWFLNFANLRVRLIDVPGYSNETVPAYLLWHPYDHVDASLSGVLGPGNTARPGAKIRIREAMNFLENGWRYKVDNRLSLFYVGDDGWAMGMEKPLIGRPMVLRIHFKDVYAGGQHLGAHYHYEIVIGVGGDGPLVRWLNQRITRHFSPAFFEAWHTHNTIEVGVFENFLPALYEQRSNVDKLVFDVSMNSMLESPVELKGFSRELFDQRVAAYREADDMLEVQATEQSTFL